VVVFLANPKISKDLGLVRDGFLPVTIRETGVSDFEKLAKYYFEFYGELKENPQLGLTLFDNKPGMLDEMGWFISFQKACETGDALGLVAIESEEIVGFCEVDRRKPTSAVSHRGGLGITVKKGYRGKGIGTMLLKGMIEMCRKRGLEVLELEVFVGNEHAKRLYQRLGFKRYGLHPQAVKRNGTYIGEELMFLKL